MSDYDELLEKFRFKGVEPEIRTSTIGAWDGKPLIDVILLLKVSVGAIIGGFLAKAGEDLWDLLKRRLFIHKKAETSQSRREIAMFIKIKLENLNIIARVRGFTTDEELLRESTYEITKGLSFVLALYEEGIFSELIENTILVDFDKEKECPLFSAVNLKDEEMDDSLWLNSWYFRNITTEVAAATIRYWGLLFANLYLTEKRESLAKASLNYALRLYGYNDALTCVGMGDLFFKSSDYQSALQWYNKVNVDNWEDSYLLCQKGIMKAILSDNKDGEDDFLLAKGKFPNDPNVYYNSACYYSRQGETDKALQNLKKSVELGFKKMNLLDTDPELNNIRDHKDFSSIRKRYRSNKKKKTKKREASNDKAAR